MKYSVANLFVVASIAFQVPVHSNSKGDDPISYHKDYDCATFAMYYLLKLEGCETNLSFIEKTLPAINSGDRSMMQLLDSAKSHGIQLRPTKISKNNASLFKCAIVHLIRHDEGHYVVIQPVGNSKTLWQVYDGLQPVKVIDSDQMINSTEWTGSALVVKHTNYFGCISIAFGILLFSVTLFLNRKGHTSIRCITDVDESPRAGRA